MGRSRSRQKGNNRHENRQLKSHSKQNYRGWKATLFEVIDKPLKVSMSCGKRVSYATQAAKKQVLVNGFKRLRELGYKLPDVRGFKNKHMKVLVQDWEKRNLSASTIQNRISIFRNFAEWIGKPNMIGASVDYVSAPEKATRHYAAEEDKSWSGQNVDAMAKIQEVVKRDKWVAVQLELQYRFGLRKKESQLLQPHGADKGAYLAVSHGTKGGRERTVSIDKPEQRELLERAKSMVGLNQSMIPPEYKTYVQWKNHYNYVCKKEGITRKDGIVSHGLRHEYANKLSKEITGQDSPIKGGDYSKVSKELDRKARQDIAEQLGHSRYTITSAYIGSTSRQKK